MRSDGTSADLPTAKTAALLGLLALTPAGVSRERAAALLWSRSPETQARTNLRQALSSLKRALGPDGSALKADGTHLSFDRTAIDCDTDRLAEASVEALLSAGPLLDGLHVNEPDFTEWLEVERARIAEDLEAALARASDDALTDGDAKLALKLSRRGKDLNPYSERAYRLEMSALSQGGDGAAALRVFSELEALLQNDLATAPSAETQALAVRIRSGEIPQQTKSRPPEQLPQSAGTAKAIIAVLPFANLSGDPDQRYFSDGITADIVTELSRLALLSVTALSQAQASTARSDGITALHEAHGIQFALDGNVRRAGDRVRISVQLTDASTGQHIWAERYDRLIADIFDLQEEVARTVAAIIPGRIREAVVQRARSRKPSNPQAYEYYLQGRHIREDFSIAAINRARPYFEKAIEADPTYAKALGLLGDTYFVEFMLGLATAEDTQRAYDLAAEALRLDPGDVQMQEGMGYAYIARGQWQEASAQFDRTITNITIEADQLLWCAYGLVFVGRAVEAVAHIRRAFEMDPLHPSSYEWVLGQALFFAGELDACSAVLSPLALLNSIAMACRVAALAEMGEHAQAAEALALFKKTRLQEFKDRGWPAPEDSVDAMAGGYRQTFQRHDDWQRLADGLRAAGLP